MWRGALATLCLVAIFSLEPSSDIEAPPNPPTKCPSLFGITDPPPPPRGPLFAQSLLQAPAPADASPEKIPSPPLPQRCGPSQRPLGGRQLGFSKLPQAMSSSPPAAQKTRMSRKNPTIGHRVSSREPPLWVPHHEYMVQRFLSSRALTYSGPHHTRGIPVWDQRSPGPPRAADLDPRGPPQGPHLKCGTPGEGHRCVLACHHARSTSLCQPFQPIATTNKSRGRPCPSGTGVLHPPTMSGPTPKMIVYLLRWEFSAVVQCDRCSWHSREQPWGCRGTRPEPRPPPSTPHPTQPRKN